MGRPKLLLRAVTSALLNDSNDCEVVVIDDGGSIPAQQTLKHIQDQRLRIFHNKNAAGASGARNFGISKSRGDIIFFLDDDDEIVADYCQRIMKLYPMPDYGFSSYINQVDNQPEQSAQYVSKIRFPDGPIPKNAPIARKLFGFGTGFWIKRSTFKEMGDIDEYLQTNEDTEYGCRLIAANKFGWYSVEPGVIIHHHERTGEGELQHITYSTSSDVRSEFFLYVADKYPEFRKHLGRSYVKHCVRSSHFKKAWKYATEQRSLKNQISFSALIVIKFVGYKLTRKL
jgi:glycosyltransferase involved in cell wall biosynthesis